MPREVRTVASSWPAEATFAYMADFANASRWDPGVRAARRLDDGPIRVGSVFDLDVAVGPRTPTMRYKVVRMSERSITFQASLGPLRSLDTVSVEGAEPRCNVVYDAGLRLAGIARIANPLLAVAFRRIVDRAATHLAATLAVPR